MRDVELTYAAEYDDAGRLIVRLPPLGDWSIRRIQVFDCARLEVLADTDAERSLYPIEDLGSAERFLDLRQTAIDVGRARALGMSLPRSRAPRNGSCLVRLFDEDGRVRAPVPIVY